MATLSGTIYGSVAIGSTFESLPQFQVAAKAFIQGYSDQDIVPFAYDGLEAMVCLGWQEHDCSAGVAAEAVASPSTLWVVRAVEGKHDRRCFDYYFKSQGKQDFVTQVNEGSLVFSHVSEVHPSNHGELSTGARFSTLEQFQAAASAFAEKRYPNYPIYFRARKNDRPEYYCKYQNASTAQTAPGLSCKYGFNAKWRAEESSYVVTKSVYEHTTECQMRTALANGLGMSSEDVVA